MGEPGTKIHMYENVIIKSLFCKLQNFKKLFKKNETSLEVRLSALKAAKKVDWIQVKPMAVCGKKVGKCEPHLIDQILNPQTRLLQSYKPEIFRNSLVSLMFCKWDTEK